jgi:hypothetical protein
MADIMIDGGKSKIVCAIHMRNEPVGRGVLEKNLPFEYRMPCGWSYRLKAIEDLPKEDLPCPCGNPEHWFVKYTEEK